jgi:DNA mismatch endonuclease (patch repair protein)
MAWDIVTDTLSPAERSRRMALIHDRDTGPEILTRKIIHSLGYRYRLHGKGLPGKPDIIFGSRKKVIFVHGCYWHRHDDPMCKLARLPKSRLDFWLPKLEANSARDVKNEKVLREQGWDVLVIWECQLGDRTWLIQRIRAFLGP